MLFLKHDKLYLNCISEKAGEYTINEESFYIKSLNTTHYKYKFIPNKVLFKDKLIVVKPKNTYIQFMHPKTLDFESQNNIKIYFITSSAENLAHIRLEKDGNDLQCEDNYDYKECIVTKEHFLGGKSGTYFIHHRNNLSEDTINYEVFGVYVKIPEKENHTDSGRINKSNFYIFIFLFFLF